MNIEIELKFNISDKDLERIKKHPKIKISDEIYQETVMFDNKDQVMKFTDGRIRLRKEGDKNSISYKKPLPNLKNHKEEIELETEVKDFEVMFHILRAMGFSPSSYYEKYVSRADFKGKDIDIQIQKYPFANFLEIEGDKEETEYIAKELGFDVSSSTNKAIDTIFKEWRESRGLPPKEYMRFNDYDR